MQANSRGERMSLWLRWLVANVIGFTLGGAIGGGLSATGQRPYSGVVTSAAEGARILAINAGVALGIFGALIGVSQWVALRGEIRKAGWWILATTIGWVAGGVIAGALSGLIGGAVTTIGADRGVAGFLLAAGAGILAIGFLPSVAQWVILRRQTKGAGWWILVSGASCLLGFSIGFALARLGLTEAIRLFRPEDFPSAKSWSLAGVIAGALYGALSGPLLVRLLRPSAPSTGAVASVS
ncbi:MAG TPA: hypothetical protein VH349_05575 [Ktedonobacterales bacterium]|jgi:hypothetical protein